MVNHSDVVVYFRTDALSNLISCRIIGTEIGRRYFDVKSAIPVGYKISGKWQPVFILSQSHPISEHVRERLIY